MFTWLGDGLSISATCLTFNGLDFNTHVTVVTMEAHLPIRHRSRSKTDGMSTTRAIAASDPAMFIAGNYITFKKSSSARSAATTMAWILGQTLGDDYGVTMDGVYMHDVVTSCSQLSSICELADLFE